jgi:3-dehydroquinate synthase
MPAMQRLIHRCAELHLQHIATGGDPFEMGSARPLDFGHWSAHKLEQLSGYRLRHGEAVAIGLALDTTYSYLAGFCPEPDWRRVLSLLQAVGFSLCTPELSAHLDERDSPECILHGLSEFREHLGGELTITLLERIGQGFEVHEVDERTMIGSIAVLERVNGQETRVNPEAGVVGIDRPADRCRMHAGLEEERLWKPVTQTTRTRPALPVP